MNRLHLLERLCLALQPSGVRAGVDHWHGGAVLQAGDQLQKKRRSGFTDGDDRMATRFVAGEHAMRGNAAEIEAIIQRDSM